jgi:S1-C subfamily serine protease
VAPRVSAGPLDGQNRIVTLPEVFDGVRRSIVAFGSKAATTGGDKAPVFPRLVGTGFVVDPRGIIATNKHVAEALRALPPHPVSGEAAAFALVFGDVQSTKGDHTLRMAAVGNYKDE